MASESTDGLTPLERRVVTASVIIMLLFGFFFWNERAAEWLFESWSDSSSDAVAFIQFAERDVRFKDSRRFLWRKASSNARLSLGDSLFTGEGSRAVLRMRDGREVVVEPHSLIRFRAVNGEVLPDLRFGKVWAADGGGLKTAPPGSAPVRGERKIHAPVALAYPPVLSPSDDLDLVWRLEDLYAKAENGLRRLPEPRATVAAPNLISWKDSGKGPYRVQWSAHPEFRNLLEESVDGKQIKVSRVFPGINHVRISRRDSQWSEPEPFRVRMSFLPQVPEWHPSDRFLVSFGEGVSLPLSWKRPDGFASTIIEVSDVAEFHPQRTVVHWTAEEKFTVPLPGPGLYHVRLAVADSQRRVGVFTAERRVEVGAPPLLAKPALPGHDLVYELNGRSVPRLAWRAPAGAARNMVTVFDANGNVVKEFEIEGNSVAVPVEVGRYSYRVSSVDQWGRKGRLSEMKPFDVRRPAPVIAKQPEQRAPAQALGPKPQLRTVLRPTPLRSMNADYSEASLRVEGASFGMFSSEQMAQDLPLPLAATLAVRWSHWWNTLGLEWAYKAKVFNYNSAADDVSPSSVEGRVAARTTFGLNWKWLRMLREVQISALLGFESYRNPKAGEVYSPGYDLVKMGTQLEFPLASRWQTGGELIYGMGGDSSKKYEISGHLDYFVERKWTLGVGYRAHAFEAGSERTSPLGVPYREAYGEGYTVFKYHY